MDTLGKRLLKARNAKGLTQVELAHKIGEYQSKYRGWESDQYEPNLKTLNQLADVLDVSIEWLVSGKEPEMVKESGVEYAKTNEGYKPHDPLIRECIRIMDALDLPSKQSVVQYAHERLILMKNKTNKNPRGRINI